MNITFENTIKDNLLHLEIDNRTLIVEPESSVEITVPDNKVIFTAEYKPIDLTDAFDEDYHPQGLKDKILHKLTKKATEKLPDISLYSAVTYEFTSKHSNVIVDFKEGVYSKADGKIADFFDMQPIIYLFPRTESNFGDIKVVKATNVNRKSFLRLYGTVQLFLDYFCFFEIMPIAHYFSSDSYTTKTLRKLYSISSAERDKLINEKTNNTEKAP